MKIKRNGLKEGKIVVEQKKQFSISSFISCWFSKKGEKRAFLLFLVNCTLKNLEKNLDLELI